MTIKAVVITGASTGIGRACALYLDQRGWQVFAAVRKQDDACALRQQASERLHPIFIDVSQPESIAAAAGQVTQAVGQAGLAGLVNNAGVAFGGPLEFIPIGNLQTQFEVNVVGQIAVTQKFLALLRKGHGRIINISSISGRVAMPFFGPYASSKFALEALTDALRRELHPWDIKVVSIQPGSIATPIWGKSMARAEAMIAGLPHETIDLYGVALNNVRKAIYNTAQRGIPPERVASVVLHALTTKRPKNRYLVGKDAKMAAWLLKLIPDQWQDWLILRQEKNLTS